MIIFRKVIFLVAQINDAQKQLYILRNKVTLERRSLQKMQIAAFAFCKKQGGFIRTSCNGFA
jgi:hypothetical protein